MDFSEEELLPLILHSDLPTVLIEGVGDAAFYRRLESIIGSLRASFLGTGGRKMLLKLYQRRSEFAHKKVCFVCDKDLWVFTGPPAEYEDLILTEGYSIENDFYTDSDIERLLDGEEAKKNHRTLICEITKWFAGEINKFFNGESYVLDPPNIHILIPYGTFTCCPKALNSLGYQEPPNQIYDDILSHYKAKLRGKLLFKILVRFFNTPSKVVMTKDSLVHVATNYAVQGPLVNRLLQAISAKLEIPLSIEMNLPELDSSFS
jgi:hypothetical protein